MKKKDRRARKTSDSKVHKFNYILKKMLDRTHSKKPSEKLEEKHLYHKALLSLMYKRTFIT